MKHNLHSLISNLKNGYLANKKLITTRKKNICISLLNVLWKEGYISGYKMCSIDKYKIIIFLKYDTNGIPAINSIKAFSTPSKKKFLSVNQIWKTNSSKFLIVFSTNIGFLTSLECKKKNVGGEPILIVN